MEQTLNALYKGDLNPLEAVREADAKIGGITGVILRDGMTLQNHTKRISISRKGLTKRQENRLREFAALAYWQAQRNGSITPGEVHLDKGLSSKHYAKAFREYTSSLLARYNPN